MRVPRGRRVLLGCGRGAGPGAVGRHRTETDVGYGHAGGGLGPSESDRGARRHSANTVRTAGLHDRSIHPRSGAGMRSLSGRARTGSGLAERWIRREMSLEAWVTRKAATSVARPADAADDSQIVPPRGGRRERRPAASRSVQAGRAARIGAVRLARRSSSIGPSRDALPAPLREAARREASRSDDWL